MFEGLYVGAKHHDDDAVILWGDRLDAVGASFGSQNLVMLEAEDDRSAGIPSSVINSAVELSGVVVSEARSSSVGHVLRDGEPRGFDSLSARQFAQRRMWGEL
jgi:hypothetical protein